LKLWFKWVFLLGFYVLPYTMKKIWILSWYTSDNEIDKVPFAYVKAIENSWNVLVYIVPCVSKNIDTYIQELDGFLVPGGQSDVDPALYRQENQWSNNINTENDRILISVIAKIVQSWKPMLWICKGMQLINVALWGLLIQDVPNTEYSFDCIHNVNISYNSKLFQIYKQQLLSVNSLHHQAVKQVGKWLHVVANNEEWIIEAIESENWKIIWVQWHPEYIKEHECLFKDFFGI